MKNTNTRALACKILLKVVKEGKSFHPQFITTIYPKLDPRDAAFVAHLCFGVLRYYLRLQGWLHTLMRQPLKPKDQDLTLLLMIGLYQIHYTDIPPYASIHATVEACRQLSKNWALKLVNGVLREAQRQGKEIHPHHNQEIRTAHPAWLVQTLQQAWPTDWETIIEANQQHPPFALRVNLNKISRNDYLQKLEDNQIAANSMAFCEAGIIIDNQTALEALPGFNEGFVSVQDGAAQLAATLLEVEAGHHILDACAAPGGKTAHLLELHPQISVVAIEKDSERFARLNNTLKRLECAANTLCADATAPEAWWDGQLFDRILLDAPCSATGIIRRHPDIKLHRQPEDILLLAKQQTLLLEKLWPLLKPGGILIYATCSILPHENVDRIEHFLQTHPDAQEYPLQGTWGAAQKYGQQILPGQHTMDGFYYARLCKKR